MAATNTWAVALGRLLVVAAVSVLWQRLYDEERAQRRQLDADGARARGEITEATQKLDTLLKRGD